MGEEGGLAAGFGEAAGGVGGGTVGAAALGGGGGLVGGLGGQRGLGAAGQPRPLVGRPPRGAGPGGQGQG